MKTYSETQKLLNSLIPIDKDGELLLTVPVPHYPKEILAYARMGNKANRVATNHGFIRISPP